MSEMERMLEGRAREFDKALRPYFAHVIRDDLRTRLIERELRSFGEEVARRCVEIVKKSSTKDLCEHAIRRTFPTAFPEKP